ncbi:MAG: hypothetical protein PWQ82_1278 [Thermosediminibacterales bacterium]|nr:hypothetical protein [Thermosediminibacterales bacterium]MDK2836609.1 hypothetical protein [Thermosediminibacterales bacterium]
MRKKRVLSLILFFAFIFSLSIVSLAAAFSGDPDVSGNVKLSDIDGHWAEGEIVRMMLKGVAFGYSDSTFHPDSPITRLDTATMLVRLLGYDDPLNAVPPGFTPGFDDTYALPAEQQAYVYMAGRLGMMEGDEGGKTFRPVDSLTRKEAAVIVVRALGMEGDIKPSEEAEFDFDDAEDIPGWAKGYIDKAVETGLLNGYTDNTFRPDKAITRAEMTVLISRLDDYMAVPSDSKELTAEILAVSTEGTKALNLRLANGRMQHFKVSEDVNVFSESGRVSLGSLVSGYSISFVTDEKGKIMFIRVIKQQETEEKYVRVIGNINDVDRNENKFTISVYENGERKAVVVKYTETEPEFKQGDQVLVVGKVDGETIEALEIEILE